MSALAEKAGAWFLRLPTEIVKSAYIMDNASATDWRVLLAIAKHQGYQNRRTFPLYIAKTAEEARCSRRAADRSISWWVSIGALLKTKRRRVNVYEIPRHFSVPPGISATPRHNTPRHLKRDGQGRIMPSAGIPKMPPHGIIDMPAHGILNQRSSSEIFNENPPPPPKGGNGRASETSARPSLSLSEDTIKELIKATSRERVLEMLKQGNYPIPEFLLKKGEPVTEAEDRPDEAPAPGSFRKCWRCGLIRPPGDEGGLCPECQGLLGGEA